MITFFRTLRKNLLKENKTRRYLKYALGEIILVVIGILIALQINNWNEKRKAKAKEQLILKELHKEFISNKTQLDTVTYYHRRSLNSAEFIINKFPINGVSETEKDSIGKHLLYMIYHYTFDPSQGITNSLLNTSSFELISNDTLRNLLIRWSDQVKDYQEEEISANENLSKNLKPYIKKHFNLNYDYKMWLNDPRVNIDVLGSLEFENFVRDRYIDLNNIVSKNADNPTPELKAIYASIEKIIALSNTKQSD